MSATFPKTEKLKSRKEIALLFSEGKTIAKYPVRLLFRKTTTTTTTNVPIKAAVSVSKRNFKNAVDRNHIKRLLRESYRKNKPSPNIEGADQFSFLLLYTAKEMPDSNVIETKVKAVLTKFAKEQLS